jgi:hypothetical protein
MKLKDTKEEFIAGMIKAGGRPHKAEELAELYDWLLELSEEDGDRFRQWLMWDNLRDATPEERRQLFKDYRLESCPCCDRWLGHNEPPANDDPDDGPSYRRQRSFNF